MKKIIASLFIFILMFTMYCNINISYGKDLNLKYYIDNYNGNNKSIFKSNGDLNEDYFESYEKAADFAFDADVLSLDWNLSVNYNWLRSLKKLINEINSTEVTYKDIHNGNSVEDIKTAITVLQEIQAIVSTFKYSGKDVSEPDNLRNYSDLINAQRSKKAFTDIMKTSTNDFNKKIAKAVRELCAARDFENKNVSNKYNVNINDDYKTKFKYNLDQIKAYEKMYSSGRLNCDNSDIILKVWNYKHNHSGEAVATRKDIYVDKNDSDQTKRNYDFAQVNIYKAAFGKLEYNDESGKKVVDDADLSEINEDINEGEKNTDEMLDQENNRLDQSEYEEKIAKQLEGARDDPDKDTIFLMPNGTADAANGISDFANDATKFMDSEGNMEIVNQEELQDFSQNIYSMLLGVGIIVAVLVGVILGIKLMLAPIGERAEAKKLLIPYAVGCAVVFGAFGIWKLVITILSGI